MSGASRAERILGETQRGYRISILGKKEMPQYQLTLPPRICAAFIDRWGRMVTFEPREEGILIRPLVSADVPNWINNGDSKEAA